MIHHRAKYLLRALIVIISLTTINTLWAIPAKPGIITVKQPDGSVINILMNGDENFSWRTTEEGTPITKGLDGYYYYAQYSQSGAVSATAQRVSINGRLQTPPSSVATQDMTSISQTANRRNSANRISKASSDTTMARFPSQGTVRSAIILVEYPDVKFTIQNPNQAFHNQLNQEGYSVAGATGSAKDYFADNSRGKFNGQFDVYGPYTLPNKREYYGKNDNSGIDVKPDQMVWDAVKLADADGVDFAQYDLNNDGNIDNIFVYYAGHNEAEGGDENSVWPHKWVVSSKPTFDSKSLYVYACTSELRGSRGTTIAGIGTFCHEFSHVFGLMDHYDTNGSVNGTSYGLGNYDIMTHGSYNNNGNTPPRLNGLELDMIGWNTPVIIDAPQSITIEPIKTGEVYKILTEVDEEYFLIENHDNSSGWDKYTTADGLFITHVDQSSPYVTKWQLNEPNANASHECFRFVVAGDVKFNYSNEKYVPYPQNTGNNRWGSTSNPAALSWDGKELKYNIQNISRVAGSSNITFDVIHAGTKITIESNTDNVVVSEPFTLKATIEKEYSCNSITWSSSDNSIVTTSAQEELLNVEFNAMGTATFTVTYDLVDLGLVSQSITITAAKFQGARGIVYDKGSKDYNTTIPNAKIDIYPVKRTISDNTSEIARYSRSANTPTYTTTSNDEGEYKIVLNEGFYEAEITASGYASTFQLFQIENGINSINFPMSNYNNLVDQIEVEANQTDATVIWNPQQYSTFRIDILSLSSGITILQSTVKNCNVSTIGALEAGDEYKISVRALDNNSYKLLYSTTFKTVAQRTTTPLIHLESYDGYVSGEVLTLKTLNSQQSDEVVWYYDDVELQINKVTLDSGEHTIKAIVKRSGVTYIVSKMIYVE